MSDRIAACALLVLGLSAWQATAVALEADDYECFLKPSAVVEVGSPVDGVLDEVKVDRGDRVKKGQVLARLQSGVEQASVELARLRAVSETAVKSAEARKLLSEKEYQRRIELSQKQYASDTDVQEARTEKILAELALQEAQEERRIVQVELQRAREVLNLRIMRSPFDGIVVKRYNGPGDLIEQGPVFRLAKTDPVHVEVVLSADRLGSVAVGDRAEIAPEYPAERRYTATVTVVDPVVDAASGTFGVRLAIPNPDGAITPGLQCRVRFTDPGS